MICRSILILLVSLVFSGSLFAKYPSTPPSSTFGILMTHRLNTSAPGGCSAWCPAAIEEVRRDECKFGLVPFVANCRCNEHEAPTFADVQYTCDLKSRNIYCSNNPKKENFGLPYKETLYFYDKDQCSSWCDRGLKIAAPALCAAVGFKDVENFQCQCDEERDPGRAYIKFECTRVRPKC